jgi:hypothetical protein
MLLLVFTLDYIVVCIFCFTCAVWMVVRVLSEQPLPNNDNNSDGFGGVPNDFKFPVFDPSGGRTLDDWLVDRLPSDFEEAKSLPEKQEAVHL